MLQQFYNHRSYLSYDKQMTVKPEYQNYHQIAHARKFEGIVPQANENRVIEVIPEPANHIYVNEAVEDEEEKARASLRRVVSIRTLEPTQYKQNYFYGDSFGLLPRNCNRSTETIEASISFDEEINEQHSRGREDVTEEATEDDYSPIATNTLTKDQILQIFCYKE